MAVGGVIAASVGLWYANQHGLLDAASTGPASIPKVAQLPAEVGIATEPSRPVPILALPSNAPVTIEGPEIRYQIMAWNSQMGVNLATGGPVPTQGSLMEKYRVNMHVIREDDVAKMQTQLIAFCKELKSNPQPIIGAQFMAVMGDGSAATIAGMEADLKKYGCTAEVVGSAGYSRGEDKFMGPPEWKQNPRLALGSVVATYMRDGDWAIVMKYAFDNELPVNPDEKTYDPAAINWYAADDFIKAGAAYIDGLCEDRPVVVNGKRTGEKKNICVNAVSSWTPVDVNIAREKGGLVKIVSTKEYSKQMPNTIIGIKEWNVANRDLVENMLTAIYLAGDQIKNNPAALDRAAEASAVIYHEETAAYWKKYFSIQVERDKKGLEVELGGSSVNNLQDVMLLYGLLPGSPNFFAATYTTFGNVVKDQYPKLVPSFPPVASVLNTSYTTNISKRPEFQVSGKAELVSYHPNEQIKQKVSGRSWNINFDTGKASFAPGSASQLSQMKDGLLIADKLLLEVHGYTDNTGNPDFNVELSRARAMAVKKWLMEQSSIAFPDDRFAQIVGHGQTAAVATNETESGRAKNRRVEVILGN
jgi:OOP family OmpA-OmpF porin